MGVPGSGRHKIPTAMKVLKGTARKDRENPDEPMPEVVKIAQAPGIKLNKRGMQIWERVTRELIAVRVMTNEDYIALEKFCKDYAQWLEASEDVEKEGLLKDGRPNPKIRIANDAGDRADKALIQFGMTPSSRSRIHAPKNEKKSALDEI